MLYAKENFTFSNFKRQDSHSKWQHIKIYSNKNALHGSIVAVCSVTVSRPCENIIAIQYSIQQPKENL